MAGQIAHKGEKAPLQAGQRWPVERTNAWHNAFGRLQRCYERREEVIDAFFDLADAIITVRSLIRQAWTTYRWDGRPGPTTVTAHLFARPLRHSFSNRRPLGHMVRAANQERLDAVEDLSDGNPLGPGGLGRLVGDLRLVPSRRVLVLRDPQQRQPLRLYSVPILS